MAQHTPYFGLAFFDVGDNLADLTNVTKEMERFVIIDRQLYGLYSIFGSGVISGWEVSSANGDTTTGNISVEVAPGIGIVNLMAAESLFANRVDALPANQIVYIFAQITNETVVNRSVRFFYARSEFASNAVLLATVITGDNGVVSIDNTVRTEIGFQRVIEDEIKAHRHRGSPSKIDLLEETKGQLPGNKIGDVSADILTRGKLDPARIPLLDHATLKGIGLFTHPEIDAMLRKVPVDSEEQRMIEVTLVNTLREHIFLKYKYEDCDEDFINEMLFIPGISPDAWVDTEATTANVDPDSGCISGKDVAGGQSMSVRWATETAFNNAYSKSNVIIDGSGVFLRRGDIETLLVEGFESAADGNAIPGFTAQVQAVNSETGVTADPTIKVENNKSGKFTIRQTNRGVFVKTFTTPQNWSEYDRLTYNVKCTTATHGAVFLYIENQQGQKSSVYQVLSVNEMTTNTDPLMMGFEERTIVLSGFTNRSNVTKITIIVEDVVNDYGFWMDNIRLRKSQDYVAQGNIRLRYETGDIVTFNSLVYETILPSQTEIKARCRVADTQADLNDALFTPFLTSADSFILKGKWIEIDVQLFSNGIQTFTPTLTAVEVGITVDADSNGFDVNDAADWAKGHSSNITFIEGGGSLRIKTPVTVGDYVFLNEETVNEISEDKVPVFGIGNQNLPMSEWQAYDALFDANVEPSLRNPRSVVRTNDRRYIVCDTDNHRILIFDQSGKLLRAFCGANEDVVRGQEDIIGVTATYNQETGILWLGFTKEITLTASSFEKVLMNVGAKQIILNEEGLLLTANGPVTGRVIGVPLTEDHQSLLNATDDDCSIAYGANFTPEFNRLFENSFITIYFAPVSYHDFIYYPVYAVEAKNRVDKYWVCNATKLAFINNSGSEPLTAETRQLQLFDPDEDTGVFTNSVYFMKEFGGMVLEANGGMYVAGADIDRNGTVFANPLSNAPKTVYVSPTNCYPSALDFDSSGGLWVAESSENARSGRVLKMDLNGNITESFGEVYTMINSIKCLSGNRLLLGT